MIWILASLFWNTVYTEHPFATYTKKTRRIFSIPISHTGAWSIVPHADRRHDDRQSAAGVRPIRQTTITNMHLRDSCASSPGLSRRRSPTDNKHKTLTNPIINIGGCSNRHTALSRRRYVSSSFPPTADDRKQPHTLDFRNARRRCAGRSVSYLPSQLCRLA